VSEGADEPVPKLPRGRGLRLSRIELMRIAMTLAVLIALVVLMKPCSQAVSGFVMGFDGSGSSAAKAMPKPGTVDVPPTPGSDDSLDQYERLRPGMTDAELKAAIERAKAAAAAAAGSAH
jgi:hypothetical protein